MVWDPNQDSNVKRRPVPEDPGSGTLNWFGGTEGWDGTSVGDPTAVPQPVTEGPMYGWDEAWMPNAETNWLPRTHPLSGWTDGMSPPAPTSTTGAEGVLSGPDPYGSTYMGFWDQLAAQRNYNPLPPDTEDGVARLGWHGPGRQLAEVYRGELLGQMLPGGPNPYDPDPRFWNTGPYAQPMGGGFPQHGGGFWDPRTPIDRGGLGEGMPGSPQLSIPMDPPPPVAPTEPPPPPRWSTPGDPSGEIVGLENYPNWENWLEQWPGAGTPDPTGSPPPVDWDPTHPRHGASMTGWDTPFRPGDIPGAYDQYTNWAAEQGIAAEPIHRFNDAQYLQAFGQLPERPDVRSNPTPEELRQAGYSLEFDAPSTAMTDWRLNYNILDDQGRPTGYDLMASNPYSAFPWVGGGGPGGPGGPGPLTPPGRTPTPQETCELSGGTWNGFECVNQPSGTGTDPTNIVRPGWNIPAEWFGDIDPDYENVPFTPPAYAEQATYRVGEDPLSMLATANLGSLMTTGGVAPTPLAGNIEQTLQDVMGARGAGAEALSQLGQDATAELSRVLGVQGATPRTDLAQGLSTELQDIIASGGAAPTPQLGQDVSAQLRNLIATGGALPTDPQREAMEVEAARSPLDVLRRAQLSQGEAALASQGLLGSGAGQEYVERLEERLAPMYTQAAQEIELDRRQREQERFGQALTLGAQQAQQETAARDSRMGLALDQAQRMSSDEAALRQNQYMMALQQATGMSSEQANRRENRLQNAMSLATGLSQEQSRNLLATAETVTARQQMLSDVALQSLDRNMAWNQFLAQYGLDRARVFEEIQNGRIGALLPLLQMYLTAATATSQGYAYSD